MSLFDEFQRDDDGPRPFAEPVFTGLNRSACPEVGRVRHTIETWFSRYPATHREHLGKTFRSLDDTEHHAAFFELFLHELLTRLGYRAKPHPDLQGTGRHPEFLVESSRGYQFYVEARLVTGQSRKEAAARKRMNAVYDALNELESPNFFIGMKLSGAPDTAPPAGPMRSFLAEQLSALEPDEIAKLFDSGGLSALPRWRYEHEEWKIDFYPIPKSPRARGKPGVRPLAAWEGEWQLVDPATAIRRAIIKKGRRYGEFDVPYVVAVNALCDHLDTIHIVEALFGKEQFTFERTESGGSKPRTTRAPNGVWRDRDGPSCQGVSAVLVAHRILPWNVSRASIRLYHNPWAKRPLKSQLVRLPQAVLEDDRMRLRGGRSLGAILGLPPGWPMA